MASMLGIDGILRPAAEERRLNDLCRGVFTAPAGREVLAYLKAITIHVSLGPKASDAELRDMEGRRTIVAILDRRTHVRNADANRNEPAGFYDARRTRDADPGDAGGSDPA